MILRSVNNWKKRIFFGSGKRRLPFSRSPVKNRVRLLLEALEDRTLMSNSVVAPVVSVIPVTLAAVNRGWWDDSGYHDSFNDNTFTGQDGGGFTRYNSYFTFATSGLSAVTSAVLRLELESYYGPDPSELVTVYDVSTDAATLEASNFGQTEIFSDLQSGNTYGSVTFSPEQVGSVVDIALNSQAIADILASSAGGFFSVGVHVNNIGLPFGDEGVRFSSSSESRIHQLILNAPIPPVADAGGPYTVVEGGSTTFSSAGSFAPSGTITQYEWDFDYDGETFNVDSTEASPTFSAAGLDGPSERVIALRVTDDKGVTALGFATMTIDNDPPQFEGDFTTSLDAGRLGTVSGTFKDGGLLDTHTVTVNWGDDQVSEFELPNVTSLTAQSLFASSTENAILTVTAVNAETGEVAFKVERQFTNRGDYSGTMEVTDQDEGDSGPQSFAMVVPNATPAIDSIVPDHDDPVLHFGNLFTRTVTFSDSDLNDTSFQVWVDFGDSEGFHQYLPPDGIHQPVQGGDDDIGAFLAPLGNSWQFIIQGNAQAKEGTQQVQVKVTDDPDGDGAFNDFSPVATFFLQVFKANQDPHNVAIETVGSSGTATIGTQNSDTQTQAAGTIVGAPENTQVLMGDYPEPGAGGQSVFQIGDDQNEAKAAWDIRISGLPPADPSSTTYMDLTFTLTLEEAFVRANLGDPPGAGVFVQEVKNVFITYFDANGVAHKVEMRNHIFPKAFAELDANQNLIVNGGKVTVTLKVRLWNDGSTTPNLSDLNGTVFTVAVSVQTPTSAPVTTPLDTASLATAAPTTLNATFSGGQQPALILRVSTTTELSSSRSEASAGSDTGGGGGDLGEAGGAQTGSGPLAALNIGWLLRAIDPTENAVLPAAGEPDPNRPNRPNNPNGPMDPEQEQSQQSSPMSRLDALESLFAQVPFAQDEFASTEGTVGFTPVLVDDAQDTRVSSGWALFAAALGSGGLKLDRSDRKRKKVLLPR